MPYLPAAVESILGQSFREFDILIINDGSTDGSTEYLNSLNDGRVRLIHQENRGLTTTLNRMLDEVKTPWLVRQDADDIAYSQRVERIQEYAGRYPESGMYYSLADYYPRHASMGTFRTTIASAGVLRNITHAGYLLAICHPSVCLNVVKARKIGGYRFDLKVEDIDLWWRMALSYDIRLIPEKLLGVRHNASSQSMSQGNLEYQVLNTLYIQYLLVSHLWGLIPLPYDQATKILCNLIDKEHLRFREHMRKANISIGNKRWPSAIRNLVTALCASPGSFIRRCRYEMSNTETVVNGISPLVLASCSDELWKGKA
jgi:glycosyltransferase involved in cell wall biosynthesis